MNILRKIGLQRTEETNRSREAGPGYEIVADGDGSPRRNVQLRALTNMFKYGMAVEPYNNVNDPIFRPLNSFSQFIEPRQSFSTMLDAYENDSEVSFGIDFLAAISVGMGHHFTAAESTNLVDYVSEFANSINLDEIVLISGRETLAYGNSVWTYEDTSVKQRSFDIVEPMPLTTLKRIWWNGPGMNSTVGYYEFRGAQIVRMLPSEVIHFRWRVTDAQPFGLGLIAPIVSRPTYWLNRNGIEEQRRRMSLMDIKRSMEDTAHKIMKRYVPRNVYNAEAAKPDEASQMQSRLQTLEDEQDFVVRGKTTVAELGKGSRPIDLDSFERIYTNAIIKALGTPVSRLYERGSLTEASATVAKEVALMHVAGFQRQHQRMIENLIIKPWYMANPRHDANGVVIPWKFAKVRMHWGMAEKPQMEPQHFIELLKARPSAFSDEEVRNYASTGGVELLPDTWVPPLGVPIAPPGSGTLQQVGGMKKKMTTAAATMTTTTMMTKKQQVPMP